MDSSSEALVGFNDPAHSNWKLEIIGVQEAAGPGKRNLKKRKLPEPESSNNIVLHVNSLLLGRQSHFFRRKIEGWAGDGSEKIIRVTVKPGEEEYVKEVVKFIYTDEIPFVKGSDIIKMLVVANELLVPACESKCILLLKKGALTLDDALELCSTHDHTPFMAELISSVVPALLEKYGDLEEVWASTDLQQAFLELPLRIVEALLGSNDLKVQSENTAFTAAGMWLHHNEKELGEEVGAAWGRLQSQLRFVCMTPLFVAGVVAQVPWAWWNEKDNVVAKTMKLQMLSQLAWDEYLEYLEDVSPEEKKMYVPRRARAECISIDWQIPVGLLDKMSDKNGVDTETHICSNLFFCCGYMLQLRMEKEGSEVKMGISYKEPALTFAKFSDDESADGGASIEADVMKILVKGRTQRRQGRISAGAEFVKSVDVRHSILWPGWSSLGPFPDVTLEAGSIVSQNLEEAGYIIDGQLHVTAKVSLSMGSAKRKS